MDRGRDRKRQRHTHTHTNTHTHTTRVKWYYEIHTRLESVHRNVNLSSNLKPFSELRHNILPVNGDLFRPGLFVRVWCVVPYF